MRVRSTPVLGTGRTRGSAEVSDQFAGKLVSTAIRLTPLSVIRVLAGETTSRWTESVNVMVSAAKVEVVGRFLIKVTPTILSLEIPFA